MKQTKYKKRGWYGESHRHYLAAKGISTSKRKNTAKYARRYNYTPTYAAGDLPLIAADGVGTVGAAVVPLLPLVVLSGLAYAGAKHVKKKKDKTGSYFYQKEDEVDREMIKQKWVDRFNEFEAENTEMLSGSNKQSPEEDHKIAWKLNPAARYVEMDVDEFMERAGDLRGEEHFYSFREEESGKMQPLFKLSKLMVDGTPIPAPFIEAGNMHEGRHRVMAAEMLGKKKIPVAVEYPPQYFTEDVFNEWWDRANHSGEKYKETWKRRFETGRPTELMDKRSRRVFYDVVEDLNLIGKDPDRIMPDKDNIKYMARKTLPIKVRDE